MLEKNAEIFWKSMNPGATPENVKLKEDKEEDLLFEVTHKTIKSYVIGKATKAGFVWRMADNYELGLVGTDVVDQNNENEGTE
jgi:hypothetical protein